jgi:hypothetical protein
LIAGTGVIITQPFVFVKIDDMIRAELRSIFLLTLHILSHNIEPFGLKAITAKAYPDDKKRG